MSRRTTILHELNENALVREIVDGSFAELQQKLHADLMCMNANEIRGYVRARAIAVVCRTAERIAGERQLKAHHIAVLVERSLERIAHVIVRDTLMQPIVSLPIAAVPMRRAA